MEAFLRRYAPRFFRYSFGGKIIEMIHISGYIIMDKQLIARVSRNVIRQSFEGRVISRNGVIPWPRRSPDLCLHDFFFRLLEAQSVS